MQIRLTHLVLASWAIIGPAHVQAADNGGAALSVFERRCLSCHNSAEKQGALSLETQAAALAGGDSGPAIVPRRPAESLLLDYVTGDKPEMPKSGPPLAAGEVAAIRAWIASGAIWPKDVTLKDRSLPDADWWSLKPLVRPIVPHVSNLKSQIANHVDAFIVAKLKENELLQSAAADRRTLIRRLTFDLLGLPPTPNEVQAFIDDDRPDAYERLVDRLLASPHFGERWARHWLDVVHYGETHGYDKDKPRLSAWPYRDYVIRAFNADKPYGRFVEEQLAGDVLYSGAADGIEALGFIAGGPWDFIGHVEVPETKIDGKVARHLDRDDMVSTTIGTFNSLTVGCAQCHNHKFDPIPQADYYRLQAVFAALDRADKPYDRDPAVARRRRELTAELAHLKSQVQRFEERLAHLGGAELAKLDARLAAIQNDREGKQRPEFGYHSAIETREDATKWVQIDLGSPQAMARIVIAACHDNFNGIGAGFGFPLRYKIEVADDVAFETGVRLVLDRTTADVANPGIEPQSVELTDVTARYVRITATKLAPRLPTDYIFALAELQVFSPAGKNLAAGAVVSSLDSIEAPVRWRRENLVDGYYFGVATQSPEEIARLNAQRDKLVAGLLSVEERRQHAAATAAIVAAEQAIKGLPPQQLVYAGTAYSGSGSFAGTGGKPRPIFILHRGNVMQPGEEVSPGALSCLNIPFPLAAIKPGSGGFEDNPDSDAPGPGLVPAKDSSGVGLTDEGLRRAALAKWLSNRQNPLTWRSMANRLWQYHFGRGIVDTPNDFGRMGSLPTHPELLDWLAVELRDHGGSLKRLHRRMVESHTFRQASSLPKPQSLSSIPSPLAVDAENRLLWRTTRGRLEAEALRDAVLLAAGRLDRAMGGPSFQDFAIDQPAHSPHYEYHLHDPDDPRSHRRSVYRFLVRSQPQPFMAALDCADPSLRVDKRNESLSALQALALLNNGFMVTMSRHFADRVRRESGSLDGQTRALYQHALSRDPTPDELAALVAFAERHGLENACRVVLNLNEFAFVE